MTRLTVVVLSLGLNACGGRAEVGAPAVRSPPAVATMPRGSLPCAQGCTRSPTPREERQLQRLMDDAEQIRGLSFLAPVVVYVKDRTAMRAYVARAIDEDDLARSRQRYLALGLVSRELDVRNLIERLMEEELIGYYDPESASLAVRDDLLTPERTAEDDADAFDDLQWRATVVHELVHALQDQHLGLSSLMRADHSTDHANGLAAVIEGDASLAMWAYVSAQEGTSLAHLLDDLPRLTEGVLASQRAVSPQLASAPAIVREPLLFRYREGTLFAARIVAERGFSGLNRVYRSRAPSSWQIAEPERYLRQQESPELRISPSERLLASGYKPADEDTLGALEIAAALSEAGADTQKALDAWRGDRYLVWRRGAQLGSTWCLRFATAPFAERAAAWFRGLHEGASERHVQRDGATLLVTHGVGAEITPACCQVPPQSE